MGNQQPKKVGRASKIQIDVACLKTKIHLQLVRDRKNNQIIKGEKQLVLKIKSKSRNKTEQLLIAERVVNGLKYAQACSMLMGYAITLRGQAGYIADSIGNYNKMQPWLSMIYTLIFAADRLGLSSLSQFKGVMKALNDPEYVDKYVNPEVYQLLMPTPSPEEINTYMLEMAERNGLSLEEINAVGHKFTKDFKSIPNIGEGGNPYGGNQGGNGGGNNQNPYGGNQNPYGNQANNQNPYQIPNPYQNNNANNFNPYAQLNPKDFFKKDETPQNSNPYDIGPKINQPTQLTPNQNINPNTNIPPNMNITPNKTPVMIPATNRTSINSINDIQYYPEIDPQFVPNVPKKALDADFDQICQRLRQGL